MGFTVIGCVAIAMLGLWAIWYFGIRKQPDTTPQRAGGTNTPDRESQTPGQSGNGGGTGQSGNGGGKKLTPPAGPFHWQWKDDQGKWVNFDRTSALLIEAAFKRYFKTDVPEQWAAISPAQGLEFEVEITGPT